MVALIRPLKPGELLLTGITSRPGLPREYRNDSGEPRSIKELKELIDQAATEAHSTFEAAVDENRDLTVAEAASIDLLCDTVVPQLETELKIAETIQRTQIEKVTGRKMVAFNDTRRAGGDGASLVLPFSGRLPDDVRPRGGFNRIARLSAFRSDDEAFAAGMWLRAVCGREYGRPDHDAEKFVDKLGWQVSNVGTGSVGSGGGYVVPSPLAATLIDIRERVGVMRQLVDVTPMVADTLSIPRIDSGLTVYYGTENPSSDMSASDLTLGQIELIARKRYVVSQLSQELVDDALVDIVDRVVSRMGYALAYQEDNEVINGDGTSTYGLVNGLLNKIGSAGVHTPTDDHDEWSELVLADFTNTMATLPDEYWSEPGTPTWLCSPAFFSSVMLRLAVSAAGATMTEVMGGVGGRRMFCGFPVALTSRMPRTTSTSQKCCLFGNFTKAVTLGERIGIRVARSDDVAFLKDLTTLRATTRYDINVHTPGDASNAGAYVALSTHS